MATNRTPATRLADIGAMVARGGVVHRVDACQQADTHHDQQRYTVMPGPRGTIVPPAVVAARAFSFALRRAEVGKAARLPICHLDAIACTRQAMGATPSGTLAG
jgi:hypothetical protein